MINIVIRSRRRTYLGTSIIQSYHNNPMTIILQRARFIHCTIYSYIFITATPKLSRTFRRIPRLVTLRCIPWSRQPHSTPRTDRSADRGPFSHSTIQFNNSRRQFICVRGRLQSNKNNIVIIVFAAARYSGRIILLYILDEMHPKLAQTTIVIVLQRIVFRYKVVRQFARLR